MKNPWKEYVEGDVLTVDFLPNKKGGRPVCRVGGKIGFISNSDKTYCKVGESWTVAVEKAQQKCVEVVLIDRIRTAEENDELLRKKLKELAEAQKKNKNKKKKNKIHYPYLSITERKK